jgi:spermidine/putrescine transport system permease protein
LRTPPALVVPALGWFLWFLLVPLAIVCVYSVSHKGTYGGVVLGASPDNYLRAADWIYLKIFWNSLKLATLTSVSCLAIGFPMAYVMATSRARIKALLLVLVVIPFWTNFVVRAYSIKVLLALVGGDALTDGPFAVWLGMMTNYLPFMVLPLYVSLEKFDFSLLEAARDLGASQFEALRRVLVPVCRPGIVTGLIFVFTPALGEFVIPDLLGGARTMLIGNLITEQFLKTRDWPFGAALSLILIGIVMVCLAVYLKIQPSVEEDRR